MLEVCESLLITLTASRSHGNKAGWKLSADRGHKDTGNGPEEEAQSMGGQKYHHCCYRSFNANKSVLPGSLFHYTAVSSHKDEFCILLNTYRIKDVSSRICCVLFI